MIAAMPNATRRSERSRRAILTAALDLVEEVGYAKTSVEGIAARAGVGKQTIYRWWPSKGAVLLDALLALSEGDDGVEPLPDTGDLAADLKARAPRHRRGAPRPALRRADARAGHRDPPRPRAARALERVDRRRR